MNKGLLENIMNLYLELKYPIVFEDNKGDNIVVARCNSDMKVVTGCRNSINKFFDKILEPNSNRFTHSNYMANVDILFERAKKEDILSLEEWINSLTEEEIKRYNQQCINFYLRLRSNIDNSSYKKRYLKTFV